MQEELDKLCGDEVALEVAGHKIVVREVTMRDIKKFYALCTPFISQFDKLAEASTGPQRDMELFQIVLDNADNFMQAAALVTNADVEFYGRLLPDDFFKVATAIVGVNGDFFVKALAPALIKFARGISMVGTILSPISSEVGTGTKTS